MVKYLLRRTSVDVNALNRSGFTALDLLETDVSNSSALQLVVALENAGGKRNTDVLPVHQDIKRTIDSSQELLQRNHMRRGSETGSALLMRKTTSNSSSSSYYQKQRTTSRREKKRELNSEGLRSARNKITVVAVLIATVTFAASISPPGGVHQDGPSIGKSTVRKTRAFKLFIISNTLALFLSLAIVTILVSVIPFQEKSMRRLLVVTHKVMWAAASFMVVAYMAAMWVIMDDDGNRWVRVALLVIAAGTVGTVCVGLGVMLFTHWVKKTEWRKKKRASRRMETEHSMQDRTNSDLDSSQMSGYHLY